VYTVFASYSSSFTVSPLLLVPSADRTSSALCSPILYKKRRKKSHFWLFKIAMQPSTSGFMPVILATQEVEIRRITTERKPRENSFVKNYLENPFIKTVLVEWLKMKALSSNSNIIKKIATQGVFLWNFYVYMCYRLIWFIFSIFLLYTLVLFLW
jgi:hypothetical protein